MPHAAPIDSAEFIATDTVMRVVVAHEVVAGPTDIDIMLLREEARWWPGDDEPELVDTAVGEIAVSVPPTVEVADVVDTWLISEHGLRVRPGSWAAKDTEGTDLDVYLAAVAVPAVPIAPRSAAASLGGGAGEALRFKLAESVLAPALEELRQAHNALQGMDVYVALQIATAIHWVIANLRRAALSFTGMADAVIQPPLPEQPALPAECTQTVALPATYRALEQAAEILRWSDNEHVAAALDLTLKLRQLLSPPVVGDRCKDANHG